MTLLWGSCWGAILVGSSRIPLVRRKLVTFILTLCLSAQSFAWGPKGHHIVADIAREHLNTRARQAIVQLLGDDDLAAVATWADEIKQERPETFGWHFVDIPWNATGFDEARDCYHPSSRDPATLTDHHNCIVDRITMFETVLADSHAPRSQRVEALKFLVHFVADLHQPLHAIAEARGGNEVHVVQFGRSDCGNRPCELHGAWDIGLVEHAHRSERGYVAYLDELTAQHHLETRLGGAPAQWDESFHLAHTIWLGDGSTLGESYYQRNLQVLDEQLAIAGLRLAKLLNEALGK